MAQHQMSKKRKFVADGVFEAELNELFMRELAEDGYAGVEIKKTPKSTEIVILATRTQHVLGEKGRRIRELTAFIQKRFGFQKDEVELFAEKVANPVSAPLLSAKPPLQADRWSRRPPRLLWCRPLRHGERRQGLRGHRLRQAACPACQGHEVW